MAEARGPVRPRFEYKVAPHEDAVMLLEQDGMFSWRYATEATTAAAGGAHGFAATPPERRIVFELPMTTFRAPRGAAPMGLAGGGLLGGVLGRVRAYVFRFAARVAMGQVIKFLERHVQRGMIRISTVDIDGWKPIDGVSGLSLPGDRPAKILLFIHGTTSSIVGGFGALASTEDGRKFLASALSSYDAVVGFNHATLSEDPLANATELLEALRARSWEAPPHIDVIAHSRGGLVYRSLVEHLMPVCGWQADLDHAIFVACTNGGTELASPKNWQSMIDLYTNLAVGTCRAVGLLPYAKGATVILGEALKGIGAFVKYCATSALTQKGIPGLAAMQPDGDFITGINQLQPGQLTPAQANYYAIISDFQLGLVGGPPKEFPARFCMWLRDKVMDKLMRGQPNDLVVDTLSMTAIDLQAGKFIKDTLDFGKSPSVYHSNYFIQPQTVGKMAQWLGIPV